MDVEEKEAEIVSDSSLATKYLHLKECFKRKRRSCEKYLNYFNRNK